MSNVDPFVLVTRNTHTRIQLWLSVCLFWYYDQIATILCQREILLIKNAHAHNEIWCMRCWMQTCSIHSLYITINETNKTINTLSIRYCLQKVSRVNKRKQLRFGWLWLILFKVWAEYTFAAAMYIKHFRMMFEPTYTCSMIKLLYLTFQ